MEKINIAGAAPPEGHYSPAVKTNGRSVVYVSGQVPIDPFTGEMAQGGIAAQTKSALENVRLVVENAGLTLANIVKVNIFVTDIEYWDEVNAVYRDFFGEHKPARIIIPIGDLGDGILIEIDAIAEVS